MRNKYKLFKSMFFIAILLLALFMLFGCYYSSISPNEPPINNIPPAPPDPNIPLPPINLNKRIQIMALANNLNIHSNASIQSTVVGFMDKYDMVKYIETNNGWHKTIYKEKIAYVSANERLSTLFYFDKSNEQIESLIDFCENLLGIPYVLGAQRYHWGNGILNPNFTGKSFDCSSLLQYAFYKSAHVNLKTTTREQSVQGKNVSLLNLKRGDLMYFTNASRFNNVGIDRIGHVALYLGDNYILHTASDKAVIEPISNTRWSYLISIRDMF